MSGSPDEEPLVIQIVIDSDELHEAEAEALRSVAAARGVVASEDWGVLNAEVARIVTTILGDDEWADAVAQRVAYAVAAHTLVGVFATQIAASASDDLDPLDIDRMIEGHLANLT